jgi:hypothetical protein
LDSSDSTFNIHHSTFTMEGAPDRALSIQHSTFTIQHSTFTPHDPDGFTLTISSIRP